MGLMLVLLLGVLTYIYRYLDRYTRHGESITVPDLRGMKPSQLGDFLVKLHLKYEIVDSTFYDPKRPKGSVIDQDPPPGSRVKENRTLYLTMNRSGQTKIPMPSLVDASYRQAQALLETFGLKVGELIYKPDIAKNAVLGQKFHGRDIAAGTMILRGSTIDLVLGDGLSDTKVEVPDLTGMKLTDAIEALRSAMLNSGAVMADESVKDTSNALVYKQSPARTRSAQLNQGSSVDLFITQSTDKIPHSTTPEE